MEMIQEFMETNKSGDDSMFSYGSRTLHFSMESCSRGLIAGLSAHFVLTLLFVLTQLPPESWLHAHWRLPSGDWPQLHPLIRVSGWYR